MASGPHRDTNYIQMVNECANYFINDIIVVVAQLESDFKWWIIPDMEENEPYFTDMGPYDTVEEALAMCRLTATTEAQRSINEL